MNNERNRPEELIPVENKKENTTGTVKLNVSMLPRALYLVHITQGDSHQWSRVSLN